MRLHLPFQHLARGLFVAVNAQIAALRTAVAQDAESRAGQADVPRAQERKPAQGQKLAPRYARRPAHYASSSMRFLCLGFLRTDLGSIGLPAGTGPTRSRAIALTSLAASKVFFLSGHHPPHRTAHHLRRN